MRVKNILSSKTFHDSLDSLSSGKPATTTSGWETDLSFSNWFNETKW